MPTDKKKTPKSTEAVVEEKPRKKQSIATEGTKTLTKDELLDAIKGMSVLELSELVKALEETFGISAAAPVATLGAAPATDSGAGTEAPAEEQTEFNVVLKDVGASKIGVIKAVRDITALGLKEAKELVESAPKPVKEGIPKAEAAIVKEKLEAAGATAEIS